MLVYFEQKCKKYFESNILASIFLPFGLAAKVARKREYVGQISIIHSSR